MSYEDLDTARAKRAAKDRAKGERAKRGRKNESLALEPDTEVARIVA